MARMRIDFDEIEIEDQLLRAEPIEHVVEDTAQQVADRAAATSRRDGVYDVRTFQGNDRVRSHVGTADWGARWDEARDRNLTRALWGI